MCQRCGNAALKMLIVAFAAAKNAADADTQPNTKGTFEKLEAMGVILLGSEDRTEEAASEMQTMIEQYTTDDAIRVAKSAHYMGLALGIFAGTMATELRARAVQGDAKAAQWFLLGDKLGSQILGNEDDEQPNVEVVGVDISAVMKEVHRRMQGQGMPMPSPKKSDVPGPH